MELARLLVGLGVLFLPLLLSLLLLVGPLLAWRRDSSLPRRDSSRRASSVPRIHLCSEPSARRCLPRPYHKVRKRVEMSLDAAEKSLCATSSADPPNRPATTVTPAAQSAVSTTARTATALGGICS
jgi:hypothetical protein